MHLPVIINKQTFTTQPVPDFKLLSITNRYFLKVGVQEQINKLRF